MKALIIPYLKASRMSHTTKVHAIFKLSKISLSTIFGINSSTDLFTLEYEHLNRLAIWYGTDKSSDFHNYTRVYAKYFPYFKNKRIRFLEIGIFNGGSVRLWEDYFSNADLHFIDMTKYFIKYFSKRSRYHFIDQNNIQAMQKFGEKFGPFDIIIDDGGHVMEQQINSFKALFNYVNPGGMYVVEDLHTSYNNNYHGAYKYVTHGNISVMEAGKSTAVEFFKQLIDDINLTGALSFYAHRNVSNPLDAGVEYFRSKIESVHFYTSLCIIFKK